MRENRPLRDLIIYCDRPSNTVRELSRRLNSRRIYASARRRLRNTDGSLVINYGTSHDPNWEIGQKSVVLNKPSAVQAAISKVESYERFKEAGVPTVEFIRGNSSERESWRGDSRILARRDGLSSGRGITIVEAGQPLPESDFFCKYFPKTHEYRVHVFRTVPRRGAGVPPGPVQRDVQPEVQSYRVIDITQKKRVSSEYGEQGSDRTLYQRVVRSLDNGWIHAHDALHLPEEARVAICDSAVRACAALNLDFGAVDVLARFSKKDNNRLLGHVVCEVNTAPGLGNQRTLEAYCNAIKELHQITSKDRYVPVRRRVRKLVPVTFISRKGNRITRMRYRRVYE